MTYMCWLQAREWTFNFCDRNMLLLLLKQNVVSMTMTQRLVVSSFNVQSCPYFAYITMYQQKMWTPCYHIHQQSGFLLQNHKLSRYLGTVQRTKKKRKLHSTEQNKASILCLFITTVYSFTAHFHLQLSTFSISETDICALPLFYAVNAHLKCWSACRKLMTLADRNIPDISAALLQSSLLLPQTHNFSVRCKCELASNKLAFHGGFIYSLSSRTLFAAWFLQPSPKASCLMLFISSILIVLPVYGFQAI